MIFVWLFVLSTTFHVGINQMIESSNMTKRTFDDAAIKLRDIDNPTRDRSWERYIKQLRKLKFHDFCLSVNAVEHYKKYPEPELGIIKLLRMKKTIRARVLTEKFHPYISLKHIRRRLKLLEMYDPPTVEVGYVKNALEKSKHQTVSGQGILYVKLSESDTRKADVERKRKEITRPIVLIVAGLAGSDWTAVSLIINVVTNLVTSHEKKKFLGFDWWIIPLLNPDGYINSIDSKLSRNWQTNINPTGGCSGVNLDRNFLFQRVSCDHGEKVNFCDNYSGEFPFSEIESRALKDFISHRANDCQVFVAIKEGGKALVYPFASNPDRSLGVHAIFQDLLCMEALEMFDQYHTGTKNQFRFGNSGSIFGLSNGYVEDWARRHLGIPRSFAFHISDSKIQEPLERLEEYGKATLKAIQVLATSRRLELYAETFQELINQTSPSISRHPGTPTAAAPAWGREFVNVNLREKINRRAQLEMPIELTSHEIYNRYDHLDFSDDD